MNKGLSLIEFDIDKINKGDNLEINLENEIIKNLTINKEIKFSTISHLKLKILNNGWLNEHIKK